MSEENIHPGFAVILTSMRLRRILALLAIVLPLTGLAQKVRFAEKFGNDSTVFTLSVDPKQPIEAGKTFEARIKVRQTEHWHLYSSKTSDEGPVGLSVFVHPDHAADFAVNKSQLQNGKQ